jgi:hypothetical protein
MHTFISLYDVFSSLSEISENLMQSLVDIYADYFLIHWKNEERKEIKRYWRVHFLE